MMLAHAYGLTVDSVAYSEDDHRAIRAEIFEEGIPYQLRFLEETGVHNMACYVSAAVGTVGHLLGRGEWVDLGLNDGKIGLRALLERGEVDGFWFEGTMFYHYYSLCPLITLFELDREIGGMLHSDSHLRHRFMKLFDAPIQLSDPELRLPALGDLGAPRVMSLRAYRHVYEYAAGQLDAGRLGPCSRGCMPAAYPGEN